MFELLGLDKVKYLGRKLDKKMFYDNGDLSKEDKKIFIDYIDRIEMSYILNSSTLNISSFINDEYYYEAIAYLKVKLKQQDKIDKISKIINNSIPNPLVIIYEFDKEYCISTAIKRLSKTEKNKTVVEESNITDWLNINNLSENDKKFIDSISLRKIPYTNLFDFYKTINDKIYIFKISDKIIGYEDISDKKTLEESKQISEQIEKLEDELKKTIRNLKKENQFNKKMELNIKATDLEKKIKELKSIF
ncbi:DUF4391 domain-containing protein [Romboutsia timonensis]|uniref:DUF4391 domain-containing protein n=1 Tax=Romboutsia timonensis TaxID=1776391 RepID=UPI0008DB1C81|nr:DUF4391 domain-containing protein [Romboutsia timonensis]